MRLYSDNHKQKNKKTTLMHYLSVFDVLTQRMILLDTIKSPT